MKTTATHPVTRQVTAEMIAARAYDRFVRRGGTHGHDLEDWLAAEQELLTETGTTPRRPRASGLKRVL